MSSIDYTREIMSQHLVLGTEGLYKKKKKHFGGLSGKKLLFPYFLSFPKIFLVNPYNSDYQKLNILKVKIEKEGREGERKEGKGKEDRKKLGF